MQVTLFDEPLMGSRGRGVEVLALDDALRTLGEIDLRKVRVVELRFFSGLSIEETAAVLTRMKADVTMRIYPNMGHLVNEDEIAEVKRMMTAVSGWVG